MEEETEARRQNFSCLTTSRLIALHHPCYPPRLCLTKWHLEKSKGPEGGSGVITGQLCMCVHTCEYKLVARLLTATCCELEKGSQGISGSE